MLKSTCSWIKVKTSETDATSWYYIIWHCSSFLGLFCGSMTVTSQNLQNVGKLRHSESIANFYYWILQFFFFMLTGWSSVLVLCLIWFNSAIKRFSWPLQHAMRSKASVRSSVWIPKGSSSVHSWRGRWSGRGARTVRWAQLLRQQWKGKLLYMIILVVGTQICKLLNYTPKTSKRSCLMILPILM